MKRNELAEIKKMEIGSIAERIKRTRKEIAEQTVDKNLKRLANKGALKSKKRNLAQMLTILRQKQLLQQLEGARSEANEK